MAVITVEPALLSSSMTTSSTSGTPPPPAYTWRVLLLVKSSIGSFLSTTGPLRWSSASHSCRVCDGRLHVLSSQTLQFVKCNRPSKYYRLPKNYYWSRCQATAVFAAMSWRIIRQNWVPPLCSRGPASHLYHAMRNHGMGSPPNPHLASMAEGFLPDES